MSDASEYDDRLDSDQCWNCAGEGRVNHCVDGCCVDQDDIYCDICSKRCDVCNPNKPGTKACEICGKPGAKLHVAFDGFACTECQESWTEKVEASA